MAPLNQILPFLPEELITANILPRIPVKSIGRCRCVSKPWRSLFSTPQFAKLHLNFHLDDPKHHIDIIYSDLQIITFIGESDAFTRQVNFPFEENTWNVMVGSCNGLVLIKMDRSEPILMNPITLEFGKMPEFPIPDAKVVTYSLGYDSSDKDYKIVTHTNFEGDNYDQRTVNVYSLKMIFWRKIGQSPYQHPNCATGEFLNNRLHWLVIDPQTKTPTVAIAVFNLTTKKLENVPLPHGIDVNDLIHAFDIRVLEGRLALMYQPRWSAGYMEVWVMQNSWTKLTTIDFPPRENVLKLYPSFRVNIFLNEDEIVPIKNCRQLLAYNWRSGAWRDFVVGGTR